MTKHISVEEAEEILDYRFENPSFLFEALSAPGTGPSRDGNRRLAQLGDSVIKTVLLDGWYFTGDDRGKHHFPPQEGSSDGMVASAQDLLSRVGENKFLAQIACTSGLDTFIVVNNSQHGHQAFPILLKATIGAIIGATWIDSKRDVPTIQALVKRLG